MDLPCSFIVASRFLRTVSLSCASAEPFMPAAAIASVAARAKVFLSDAICLPIGIGAGFIPADQHRLAFGCGKAIPLAAHSPLRDRDFDMLFESGALTHSLVPGFQVCQWRPLDRERVPTIDESAERNLGEAQLLPREIWPAVERIIDDHPGGERLTPRRFDHAVLTLLRLRADQSKEQ